MITQEEVNIWEKENNPWKLIDGTKLKPVRKGFNFVKTSAFIILIFILIGFLFLYGIRTYYYDLYKDITNSTNVCEPTINVESTQCGLQTNNVVCESINSTELNSILTNICPDTINIHVNNIS